MWASASALLLQKVVNGLFFFYPDRWLAWVLACFMIPAFVWLHTPRARIEFQENGISE